MWIVMVLIALMVITCMFFAGAGEVNEIYDREQEEALRKWAEKHKRRTNK